MGTVSASAFSLRTSAPPPPTNVADADADERKPKSHLVRVVLLEALQPARLLDLRVGVVVGCGGIKCEREEGERRGGV